MGSGAEDVFIPAIFDLVCSSKMSVSMLPDFRYIVLSSLAVTMREESKINTKEINTTVFIFMKLVPVLCG